MRLPTIVALLAIAACSQGQHDDRSSSLVKSVIYDGGASAEARARKAHGARMVDVLGCRGCHGKELQGELFVAERGFGRIYASNLTRRLPKYSDAQIEAALRKGVRRDGSPLWAMPSEMYTHLSGPDLAGLIAYLRTLSPVGADTPPLRMEAKWNADIAAGTAKPAPEYIAEEKGVSPVELGRRHARGRMITMTACTECHGAKLEGRKGDTPNLNIVGAYSAQQFTTLMRTGKPVSGKELPMMSGVARGRFAKLTDAEVVDLYAYLNARAQHVK